LDGLNPRTEPAADCHIGGAEGTVPRPRPANEPKTLRPRALRQPAMTINAQFPPISIEPKRGAAVMLVPTL